MTQANTLARPIWEWDGSAYQRSSYGQLVDGARHAAAGLRRRGVKPGEIVPAVITNGSEAARAVAGIWFAGATVASLPIPARGMTLEKYFAQLKRLCASLDVSLLLTDERLVAVAGDDHDLGVKLIDYGSLTETAEIAAIDPPSLDDVIFIQFSSGTTGEPRGVDLTGRAIELQLLALREHERADPERDVVATWLPMSHDMAFFGGFMAPWYNGISGLRSPPERFLQDPQSWLDDCARFRVTLTEAPPFALALATRAERLRPSNEQLSLRSCIVGAEQIVWSVLEMATSVLERRGCRPEVITPGYGLAEATLAVTLCDQDARPTYIDVDAQALAEGEVRMLDPDVTHNGAPRRVVSCGTPLEGVHVRIDEVTGEIVVSGPMLASGYHGDPGATNARFRNGELWTGDLGFIERGELYVIGRTDDVLIVGGRNIHAVDIEEAIGAERGVRKGNCAIVDTVDELGARIVLVAELDGAGVDTRELSMRLRRASIEAAGVPIDRFVFLPKGAFPKTPSGKAQRYRCRAIAQQPDVAAETVDLGVRRASG